MRDVRPAVAVEVGDGQRRAQGPRARWNRSGESAAARAQQDPHAERQRDGEIQSPVAVQVRDRDSEREPRRIAEVETRGTRKVPVAEAAQYGHAPHAGEGEVERAVPVEVA